MKNISLQHVTKIFSLRTQNTESLFTTLLHFLSPKRRTRRHVALEDVSCSFSSGEVVGIIGNNGAGKSTLLKMIAGVFETTDGVLHVDGNILFIGGVSKAFPPRLTVQEITFLTGTMLGLSHKDITEKFDDIVAFAELEEYTGTQVYQLSRGMVHRLAFSVVVHCALEAKPDIVLLDEVFSKGGDIHFREKAQEKMEEFIASGATVIFVSHNMDVVKKYATRALWLEKGRIYKDGPAQEIVSQYEREN